MARAQAKKMPIQASRKRVSGSRRLRHASDGGGGHQRGEDDPPAVDEEHQRVLQLVRIAWKRVSGEVLGEFARGHGAGGEAGENLPRDEYEERSEQRSQKWHNPPADALPCASRLESRQPIGCPTTRPSPHATEQYRNQKYRLVRHHRRRRHRERGKQP